MVWIVRVIGNLKKKASEYWEEVLENRTQADLKWLWIDDRNTSLCHLHTTEHSHSEEKLETDG